MGEGGAGRSAEGSGGEKEERRGLSCETEPTSLESKKKMVPLKFRDTKPSISSVCSPTVGGSLGSPSLRLYPPPAQRRRLSPVTHSHVSFKVLVPPTTSVLGRRRPTQGSS